MEVPRLWVELELQLLAYATATALIGFFFFFKERVFIPNRDIKMLTLDMALEE